MERDWPDVVGRAVWGWKIAVVQAEQGSKVAVVQAKQVVFAANRYCCAMFLQAS